MKIALPYGNTMWCEEVPAIDDAFILEPSTACPVLPDVSLAVSKALSAPVGSPRLSELVQPSDSVAIVVCDITRPSPSRHFLDGLVEELQLAGVPLEKVTVVVATGVHRASTQEELKAILGEKHLTQLKIVIHNAGDDALLVFRGETEQGVPIWINRVVSEASVRIVTSVVAPHQLAGFSGGPKLILPGVAGEESIRRFHSYPVRPTQPSQGQLTDNTTYKAALQAARIVGVHFSVHAVSDPHGRGYLGVYAGDLDLAHHACTSLSAQACQAHFPNYADLTICTPGGYPRDINLHQSQKALSVAELVTRRGGVIVLLAECRKGIDSHFARWLDMAETPQEVIDRFHLEGWSASSGKAEMFARAASHHRILVVSDAFDRATLANLFLEKATSLTEATEKAFSILGKESRVMLISRASGIIPVSVP